MSNKKDFIEYVSKAIENYSETTHRQYNFADFT